MIRIEDFLFVENIDQTQSESLIDRFPNLNFRTKDEFYAYFERQNIRLQRGKAKPAIVSGEVTPAGDPGNDSQILLERLKNFKSSSDYDYVKKYIIKQKTIQDSISSNNLELGKSALNEITQEKLDPFFNFIVRKILTGSETGILPSENLKNIFDDLTKKTKRSDEINTDESVQRDSDNRIISYKNYLKNRGSIHVPLIDYRFTVPSVEYVIPKSFSSIPDAVNAEKNVLKKAEQWASDVTIVADQAVLIEKLKELINEDDRTVPALEIKVENLSIQLEAAKEREQSLMTTTDNLVEAIDQLSNEYLQKAAESQAKDQEIIQLNQAIDNTLTDLQTSVSSQLEDSKASFDNLSAKLEQEANKRSEEIKAAQQAAADAAKSAAAQSAAQLDAFKESINKITDAITKSGNAGTSGTSGSNTKTNGGGGTGNTSNTGNTTGTSGRVNRDVLTDTRETQIRREIIDAINSTRIPLESLENVKDLLKSQVTLPDSVLANSKRTSDMQEYTRLLRAAKDILIGDIRKVPSNDDEILLTVWTDLRDSGLITSSTGSGGGQSGTSGSNTGTSSTSGRSGTTGRGGGGGGGKGIL